MFLLWYSSLELTANAVDVGALMEPLAVVWHAVKQSNMQAGDKVLIVGAGPVSRVSVARLWKTKHFFKIGLLALRVAR